LELEALLEAQFRLEGETIIRKSTGREARCTTDKLGYRLTSLATGRRGGSTVGYHRVKFFLAFGWLPEEVDHRDLNRGNNALGNLRPATHQQNMRNRRKQDRPLPRGVYRSSSVSKPYRAQIRLGGKITNLGNFSVATEASCAVEARLKALHGEFYRDPTD
jgi:hypothetical protein